MFEKRLQSLRKEAGFTQKELAEKFNIKQPTYAQWENGRTKPRGDTLNKFAAFFNVSVDYLLGHTDIKNPSIIDEEKLNEAVEKSIGFTGKPATEEEKESMKEALRIYLENINNK